MHAHEDDEWHRDVHLMTEWDRADAYNEPRRAQGITGDLDDERYGTP